MKNSNGKLITSDFGLLGWKLFKNIEISDLRA